MMSIDLLNRRAIVSAMVFLSVFITSVTPSSAAEKNKASSKVYFALGDQHQFPLTEERSSFGCSDKIFTVVELSHLPKTKYDLAIVWIDPSNTERERTVYPFTVVADETRLWSWLSLSPSAGAAMIQWINPAAGLEEFVGPWTVEIRINDRKITSKSFEVIC
ncbi:MAG: hypothetical protein ACJAYF_003127 [Arenicella sp.]|jgi:hypothetical protein